MGYSHTNEDGSGYELHLTSTTSTGALIMPLTADVTTANVQDNSLYVTLTSSLVFSLPSVLYMKANPAGYDNKKLYKCSKKALGINLI